MQLTHQPQEIEVWYILPAIRKEIAKELKKTGMSQVEISKILGVTKASITHYIKDKRAKNIDFPKQIMCMIKNISKELNINPENSTNKIQKIIQEIRSTGLLCKYHKQYSQIEKECTVCIG